MEIAQNERIIFWREVIGGCDLGVEYIFFIY